MKSWWLQTPASSGRVATNPYTSLNGHMFSRLDPSGKMALRLPAGEREEFLKKYKTTLFHGYGIVQKEYVSVPDGLLNNTKELKKYFDISVRYVRALKPKWHPIFVSCPSCVFARLVVRQSW